MSKFFEAVDNEFYARVAADNGGELPADLRGPQGEPRRLDPNRPGDVGYIRLYRDLMAKATSSAACPGAAPAVKVIKAWIKRNKSAKKSFDKKDTAGYVLGEIVLTASGSVGGEATWNRTHGQSEWSATDASGNAKIGFRLRSTLDAKSKLDILFATVSAEAKLEASAASEVSLYNIKGLSKDGDVHLACVLHWNGLVVRGLASGGLGGNIATKNDDEEGDGAAQSDVGVAYEEKSTTEHKLSSDDGQEFTHTKLETGIGGSLSKQEGVNVAGSASIEWTMIEPRTWNFTDQTDPSTKAPPLGTFRIFQA